MQQNLPEKTVEALEKRFSSPRESLIDDHLPQIRRSVRRQACPHVFHRGAGSARRRYSRQAGSSASSSWSRVGLTSYYTGRDAGPAWRSDMPLSVARALGINSHHAPKDEELDRLFEGKRADTGEAWSKHKREISGYDFTFSPHKSVTLAADSRGSRRGRCDPRSCSSRQ